jgi:hypothetical protein
MLEFKGEAKWWKKQGRFQDERLKVEFEKLANHTLEANGLPKCFFKRQGICCFGLQIMIFVSCGAGRNMPQYSIKDKDKVSLNL